MVEASIGHIRDLPQGAKEIPAEYRDQAWSRLGVNVDHDFEPLYVVSSGKAKHVKMLRDLVKNAKELYLATDEDREGEAISWHLERSSQAEGAGASAGVSRNHERSDSEALEHPRAIDADLVRAQETRRILDRLYGYEVSPLLWRKVRPKLSAGRVQSVAVRLIVERERERMAFNSATYWDFIGKFANADGAAIRGADFRRSMATDSLGQRILIRPPAS